MLSSTRVTRALHLSDQPRKRTAGVLEEGNRTIVEFIRAGAYDYVAEPLPKHCPDELRVVAASPAIPPAIGMFHCPPVSAPSMVALGKF